MTKLTSYLIFLGCLSTILVPELNFGLDELLNGKEIVSICIHLYTPLAVIADIFLLKMLELLLVLLSKVNLSNL